MKWFVGPSPCGQRQKSSFGWMESGGDSELPYKKSGSYLNLSCARHSQTPDDEKLPEQPQ